MTFLAHLHDTSPKVLSIELVPIVFDFQEVFPQYLPGMPLDSDIDFCIDLELGTHPISISPYKMALVELRELKVQL